VRFQPVEVFGGQLMLGNFRSLVYAFHRHAGVVGEIRFPQSMCPDDLERPTFPFARESQPAGFAPNQAVLFHTHNKAQNAPLRPR
jgi:hypothetical protein